MQLSLSKALKRCCLSKHSAAERSNKGKDCRWIGLLLYGGGERQAKGQAAFNYVQCTWIQIVWMCKQSVNVSNPLEILAPNSLVKIHMEESNNSDGGVWKEEERWDLLDIYGEDSVQNKVEWRYSCWAVFEKIGQFNCCTIYIVIVTTNPISRKVFFFYFFYNDLSVSLKSIYLSNVQKKEFQSDQLNCILWIKFSLAIDACNTFQKTGTEAK